jgi:hypothetical protein
MGGARQLPGAYEPAARRDHGAGQAPRVVPSWGRICVDRLSRGAGGAPRRASRRSQAPRDAPAARRAHAGCARSAPPWRSAYRQMRRSCRGKCPSAGTLPAHRRRQPGRSARQPYRVIAVPLRTAMAQCPSGKHWQIVILVAHSAHNGRAPSPRRARSPTRRTIPACTTVGVSVVLALPRPGVRDAARLLAEPGRNWSE